MKSDQERLTYNAIFILFYMLLYVGLGFEICIVVMLAHVLSELNMIYKRLEK